jgi:polyhydroxyalkanoate synthase
LRELLKRADTGSIDYKRFSFIIQLLWDYMNPELNPFFYEDGTFEKGLSALLLSTGVTALAPEHETWDYCVGGNLATTEGYVVFENEIMQLLYYPGLNAKNKEKPVFIIPPWINKYYIFDLSEHNSYINWLNQKNIAVYCVSWVNPDSTFSGQSFAHYITKGIHCAVEKALTHSAVQQINMVGYCVGGVALHVYAGWLGEQKIRSIASLTFLATPFDFEKLDNLRLFMSEDQLNLIEGFVAEEGVFKGDRMMQTFALLRTNDLIIHAIIDQIYLRKKQKPLDFLFWNADVMHLPGKMHLDFLRDIFIKNAFIKKLGTLSGLSVNFEEVDCPVCILGTKKDHIVPWESCYSAFDIYKNVTFCLGGAGHVAGIINPPHQKKYGYHTSQIKTKLPHDWFAHSDFNIGSWWTHWHQWVKPHLGKIRQSRQAKETDIFEKAPGRYALQKAPHV